MHIVAIRLRAVDFLEGMKTMRIWLDQQKFEPSVFEYEDVGDYLMVKVSFKVGAEAKEFEKRFKAHQV